MFTCEIITPFEQIQIIMPSYPVNSHLHISTVSMKARRAFQWSSFVPLRVCPPDLLSSAVRSLINGIISGTDVWTEPAYKRPSRRSLKIHNTN